MGYQKTVIKAMKLRGITPTELADKIGTSRGYISKLLSGQIKDPSFTRTLEICHVLGISIDALVDETPIQPPNIKESSPELEELIDAFIQLPLPDQRGIIRICKALVKHLD